MRRRQPTLALTAIVLLLLSATVGAGESGWFGLAISVDADGAFNPTLRSITIAKVFPSTPAALAGLAPGDKVLEIQGIVVAGTKADVLKGAMQKSVGETLRLKIQRGASDIREVSMVAAHKPPEQQ
jgi:C-terminal processing protease CtpA/Prc